MTYGAPSLADGWQALKARGQPRSVAASSPVFGQSHRPVFDAWARAMKPSVIAGGGLIRDYHAHPSTSRRWAMSVVATGECTAGEHLLMSFHGIPEKGEREAGSMVISADAPPPCWREALGWPRAVDRELPSCW